jgi:hypothetical protein
VGIDQLVAVMRDGLAYGRSQEYLSGAVFQTLTWLRGVGVAFFVTGMLPLVWFVVSRAWGLKAAETPAEPYVVPPTVLATAYATAGNGNGNGNGSAKVPPVRPAEEEVMI